MGRATDFDYGANVPNANAETPTYACFGKVVCKTCGKQHGYCNEVTAQLTGVYSPTTNPGITPEEWNNYMIRRGGKSDDGGGRKARTGYPYLKPEHCSSNHEIATVQSARTEPDNFQKGAEQVSLQVKFRGQIFLYTLREVNPNLDTLCDAFTPDETLWVGKRFALFLERDAHTGNVFMRVDPDVPQGEQAEETVATKVGKTKRG